MFLGRTGVACTPTFMVGETLQSGALITVLDDYPTEPSTLYAVYPHNRYLSPKVQAFVDFFAERFAPPAPWDRGTWSRIPLGKRSFATHSVGREPWKR